MKRTSIASLATCAIVLAVAPLVADAIGRGPYFASLATIGLLSVASASAWDLVGGLAGQVSFGHAAFFGIGAYVTAILVRADVPLTVTFLPSAVASALYALLWGWPCLRLRGPFFAIATIGIGEASRLMALAWESTTGGATGLTLPIAARALYEPYYLALILGGVAIATAHLVRRSRLGLGLACIREDIDAAESIGVPSGWLQAQALMLSAAIVGIAGSIYARHLLYVEPGDVFSFNRSIGLILMAVIGGVNRVWGPPLGAVLYLVLEQVLAAWLPQLHLGVYGLLLILIILFEPQGLLSLAGGLRGRLRQAR